MHTENSSPPRADGYPCRKGRDVAERADRYSVTSEQPSTTLVYFLLYMWR